VYRGFLTSFVGHALLLAWAFISINRVPPQIPATVMIEATLVTPGEFTRLKKGDPNAKVLEARAKDEPPEEVSKKEAEKPNPVTAPPPPSAPPPPEPEETEAPAPPQPDEIAEKIKQEQAAAEQREKVAAEKRAEAAALQAKIDAEQKAAEAEKKAAEAKKKADAKKKAEAKKKADAKKRAEAKRKAAAKKKKEAERKRKEAERKKKLAEAKKKQFDPDRIAALLDKTPDKRGAPKSATPPTKPTDYTGPAAGERQGSGTQLTAREIDLLKAMINSQLQPCSKLPGGGGGPDTPVVSVRFSLRPDGSLNGEPVLINRQSSPLYEIAARASLQAVKQCAPFNLPADNYSAWSTVTWEFDWPVILGLVHR
jgi:colicin import membrane protein